MNINSTYKILDELGLKISDYKLFGEFVRNNNNSYEESIDIIRKAKSVKDKKINYTDFEKRMVGYFKEIQRLINKDSLFVFSNEEDKDNFKKYFQSIIDKYIIIYKLKDDKDNVIAATLLASSNSFMGKKTYEALKGFLIDYSNEELVLTFTNYIKIMFL